MDQSARVGKIRATTIRAHQPGCRPTLLCRGFDERRQRRRQSGCAVATPRRHDRRAGTRQPAGALWPAADLTTTDECLGCGRGLGDVHRAIGEVLRRHLSVAAKRNRHNGCHQRLVHTGSRFPDRQQQPVPLFHFKPCCQHQQQHRNADSPTGHHASDSCSSGQLEPHQRLGHFLRSGRGVFGDELFELPATRSAAALRFRQPRSAAIPGQFF